MSITDELREFAPHLDLGKVALAGWKESLLAIADRIDAEHERQLVEARAEGMQEGFAADKGPREFVELPKDADDVPWNPGDRDEDGNVIISLKLAANGWHIITDGDEWPYCPERHRHHHAPTVEDVLRDVVTLCHNTWKEGSAFEFYDVDDVMKSGNIAEYAAKLRLAEGEDE